MPSPRWQKAMRDAWLHKSRTALAALAIAVGIIGAGAVLDTWALLRRATRAEFSASEPASATIRTENVDDSLLAQIRRLAGIKLAESRRSVAASVFTSTGWRSALLMSSPDLAGVRIGLIKAESGKWPPGDDGMIIESSSVDFAGAAIGDSMPVRIGQNEARKIAVAGVARDVGLAPGWMEHVVYVFVSPQLLATLGAGPQMDEVRIVVRDRSLNREEVRRISSDVKAVIERTGRKVTDIDVPVPGRHIHAGQIDSLLYTQGAFGLLALILSGFLVVNLVSAMLAGQVREIGVMKAIGARPSQLAWLYLVQSLAIGAAASIVAIPLALLVGRLYARFTADLLNFDIAGASVPSSVIIAQVGVGLLLPVVAAAFPVMRGTRIPVTEALRDFGIGARGDSGSRLLDGIGGLARPMLLSLRNAFRRRARMILTLTTLSMGGAVYLGAINLRASVIKSVDSLFGAQGFDMVIRFASPHSADSISAIARTADGVLNAEAWSGARASVRRPDGSSGNAFPLTAPPSSSRMIAPTMIAGRFLRAGDTDAIVINKRLLDDEPGLRLGETVTLLMKGKESRWRLVGITETAPSPTAYAAREAVAPLVAGGGSGAVVVKSASDDPAYQFDLLQQLKERFTDAGLEISTGQLMLEQRKVVEDHLLMVAGFLGVMAKLIIIVGGLGLASTMSLGVLERTREIGVMRAIGARHGSILRIIEVEGLVIAILSWIAAIPLSIPMSVVLARAFGRIMLPVPVTYVPEPGGVVRWLVIATLVSLVACAWPALKAMRIPAARALAYE